QQNPQLYEINVNDKLGFIDKTGAIVIPPRFAINGYGTQFSEGLAPVYFRGKWCYINQRGEIVIRTNFDRVDCFGDGLARVAKYIRGPERQTIYGYIDKQGKVVIEPQFEETYGFSEGLGRVVVNGKWGFIDKSGRMVIAPQFRGAYWFSEGLASVVLEDNRRAF